MRNTGKILLNLVRTVTVVAAIAVIGTTVGFISDANAFTPMHNGK